MSKTQKLEMTIISKVTGNNPDKVHDKFIEKFQELLKSECEILEEKDYVLDVHVFYRKLKR